MAASSSTVARSTPRSCAHCSSRAAIGRPTSKSCQVLTEPANRGSLLTDYVALPIHSRTGPEWAARGRRVAPCPATSFSSADVVPSSAARGLVEWCGWHGMQGVRGSNPQSFTTARWPPRRRPSRNPRRSRSGCAATASEPRTSASADRSRRAGTCAAPLGSAPRMCHKPGKRSRIAPLIWALTWGSSFISRSRSALARTISRIGEVAVTVARRA